MSELRPGFLAWQPLQQGRVHPVYGFELGEGPKSQLARSRALLTGQPHLA
jgi:hypothetical protein